MQNDIYARRRENLARLMIEPGAKTQLATKLDMTQPQVSHWLRDPKIASARKITEDSARAIERALKLPVGELDRGPRSSGAVVEATPVTYTAPTDVELLTATTRAVLLEVGKLRGPQLADKVAGIVTLAYAHATDHGELDTNYVHQLVKLMN